MGLGKQQEEAGNWRLIESGGIGVEEASGIAALLNPTATIISVTPDSIRPGDRIDLAVLYSASNQEEGAWQTMVVVKEGAVVLVQERQKHTSKSPAPPIRADCDTGRTMPSTTVNFIIEVWAHPDYWTTTTPY